MVGCSDSGLKTGELPDLAVPPGGPAAGALGAPCVDNSQCNGGVCLPEGKCSHACPAPACEAGWSCVPGPSGNVCECAGSGLEMCNGIDDDCNGVVDDNALCAGGAVCQKGACVCLTPSGPNHTQLVASQILLPASRTDYAVDLNGDGRVDNQYGSIVAALTAQGIMLQQSVDAQVMNGQIILLFDEEYTSASDDPCAGATVEHGQAQVAPDFSGTGSFTGDHTNPPGDFAGTITSGTFLSTPVPTAQAPYSVTVYLPLLSFSPDTPATPVPLTGAQLELNPMTGRGQLNGAIKKSDIDTKVIPSIATLLDQSVQMNPTSSSSQQTLQIFDTGGAADPTGKCGSACQNPDGSCATRGDGHISTCEVGTNSIIENVLAPDVDLFDANGNWAPNPANTGKDSLSVGFAVTVVSARF